MYGLTVVVLFLITKLYEDYEEKLNRVANLHISTNFLLNAGTVPTVGYIFFNFIIGYEKNTAELQLLKKNMVVIFFRN